MRIDDVPALEYLDTGARHTFWSHQGLLPVLGDLSRILADLDLSTMDRSADSITEAFLSEVSEPARSQASSHLNRGNAVLHPMSLLLAIKEVIEYADIDGESVPSRDELLEVLLSIASEAHEAAFPTPGAEFDQALGELTVNRIAQALLLFPEPLEMLLATTHGTWYRSWPDRISNKTKHDLADGPAQQWAQITGVELDDFLSLGWFIFNLWKHEGFSRIDSDFFSRNNVAPAAVDFLVEHCSLTVPDLRSLLLQERANDNGLWARYKLQQFPFVRLDNGTLVPIRFQFVIQRIFGDHLFLESEYLLRKRDNKKADHYAEAMRSIFEERVAEVLERICSYDTSDQTALIQEDQMKRAWRTNKANLPKICDFAMFRDHGCILVDANMRNLPQPFAEGSGTWESLQKEIEERYTTTKFKQLLSTVDLFLTRGWNRLNSTVTSRTRFVPLVVVPDAGMPSEVSAEGAVFVSGMKLVRKYNDNQNFYKVHVPAIIGWRDLLILDGLAEKGVDIFAVLKHWRKIDPLGRYGGQSIPLPIREYVDEHHPGSSMSQQEQKRGWDLFERLRDHASQRMIEAAPPALRDSLARSFAEQRRSLPTWENRRSFEMRAGQAVRIH